MNPAPPVTRTFMGLGPYQRALPCSPERLIRRPSGCPDEAFCGTLFRSYPSCPTWGLGAWAQCPRFFLRRVLVPHDGSPKKGRVQVTGGGEDERAGAGGDSPRGCRTARRRARIRVV